MGPFAKDGTVRSTIALALTLNLIALTAFGQVPRDPLAGSAPVNGGASAAGTGTLPAPFVTKQADVEIPFSVRPGSTPDSQPTAVRVFVSWDQGKSWHFYDERKPQDGRFRFRPRQDGEFWFATQTIDRSGKSDSTEPRRPQLRLIVDTNRCPPGFNSWLQAAMTCSGCGTCSSISRQVTTSNSPA